MEAYKYLRENNLMPDRQSSYRRNHSTETVVLDVLADAYAAADAGKLTFLGLLDQSLAFDVVDHDILINKKCENHSRGGGIVLVYLEQH